MKHKIADRIALKWANIRTESSRIESTNGKVIYRISVNFGDMTRFIPELDAISRDLTDEPLSDDTVQECFEELFLTKRNRDIIDAEIHNKVRHEYNFEVVGWLEDYGNLPKKIATLKDVTLDFEIGMAFEPPADFRSSVESALQKIVQRVFA